MEASTPLVCLLRLRGVGRRTAWTAASDPTFQPSSASELWDWLNHKQLKRIQVPQLSEVEQAWEEAILAGEKDQRKGISVLTCRDQLFPKRLKKIQDPPVVLYVKGEVASLENAIAVAIIGTREPSEFGEESARRIASFLACSGAVIVSGLARGCDTAGHRGCLDAQGKTVAVLAHGLDSVHPRENRILADEIVASGGALVSEYATGTKPSRNFFVERDRLQSGLSDAVIVIETGTSGGTLHTARFCLEQKRKLAAIKHTEKWQSHPKAQGNAMLINEGKAKALVSKADVNALLTELYEASLDNEHCDHWIDGANSGEKQLSLL